MVLVPGSKSDAEPRCFLQLGWHEIGGCPGNGARSFSCQLTWGYSGADLYSLFKNIEKGDMSGPYLRGLEDRWSQDSDQRESICLTDYTGNGSRIVILPIVKWSPGEWVTTTIVYGEFFLRNLPKTRHDDLVGEFQYFVVFGSGGGDSTNTAPDAYAPNADPSLDSSPDLPARPTCIPMRAISGATSWVSGPAEHGLLLGAFPNPARAHVDFRVGLTHAGAISLTVHDVAGRLVKRVAGGSWPAGERSVGWDLRDGNGEHVSKGVYFVSLRTDEGTLTRPVIVR